MYYYYFTNKEDLYLYLINRFLKTKENYLNQALAVSEM